MSDIYKSLTILFFIISFNGFSQVDTDGDGINDDVDNCPLISNSTSVQNFITADLMAYSVKVDSLGYIYVGDRNNNRVVKYNSTGTEYTCLLYTSDAADE